MQARSATRTVLICALISVLGVGCGEDGHGASGGGPVVSLGETDAINESYIYPNLGVAFTLH